MTGFTPRRLGLTDARMTYELIGRFAYAPMVVLPIKGVHVDDSEVPQPLQTHAASPARGIPWFDVLLWMNLAAAGIRFARHARYFRHIQELTSRGEMWLTPEVLFELATGAGLAVALFIAAAGCLRRQPNARMAMMVCCVLVLASPILHTVRDVLAGPPMSDRFVLFFALSVFSSLESLIIAIVTLIVLRRPLIREMFVATPRDSPELEFR